MTAPSSYAGAPGGPRDPATPGGYCLARCYCRTCPQHAEQTRLTELLRQQEYAARDRKAGERAAQREKRTRNHERTSR